MKKLNYIIPCIMGMALLAGCQEEPKLTINPAAEQEGGLSFIMNEPSMSSQTYILRHEDETAIMETLTVREQPDYGYTAAPKYYAQVCFDNNFEEGKFIELGSSGMAQKIDIVTLEMNEAIKALTEINGGVFTENPDAVDVYIRLRAHLSDATATATGTALTVKDCYSSNYVKLHIQPYFLLLSGNPVPWYITGSLTPNGGWKTDDQTVVIPFSFIPDELYTEEGNGLFTYTGWFSANDGFKFIGSVGSSAWDNQVGLKDGEFVFNDGGSGNITVAADGYYTFNLNTKDKTCEVVAYEASVPEPYTNISIVGNFEEGDGWGTSPVYLQPMLATNNHVWSGKIVLDKESELKLRANDAWDVNWGGTFPVEGCSVVGEGGGPNFVVPAGEYIITLNDIDNCIYFFVKS